MNELERMEELTDIRRMILNLLKKEKSKTIAELAERLGVTYEATRQQVVHMEREGWIVGKIRRSTTRSAGRPISRYMLTALGDHLFPKGYDQLAIKLIDTVGEELGGEALKRILAAVTEEQVRAWEPMMRGKSLDERLALLRDLYVKGDSFMEIERTAEGIRLIERNCPYLNVAMRHPALCSTSVSVLARLLGVKVLRQERFQSGDQCCAFRILTDQPIDPASFTFEIEPAAPTGT
jgi:predicted ArsR family transcriptional regulator